MLPCHRSEWGSSTLHVILHKLSESASTGLIRRRATAVWITGAASISAAPSVEPGDFYFLIYYFLGQSLADSLFLVYTRIEWLESKPFGTFLDLYRIPCALMLWTVHSWPKSGLHKTASEAQPVSGDNGVGSYNWSRQVLWLLSACKDTPICFFSYVSYQVIALCPAQLFHPGCFLDFLDFFHPCLFWFWFSPKLRPPPNPSLAPFENCAKQFEQFLSWDKALLLSDSPGQTNPSCKC